MPTKTITIEEDVYEMLRSLKGPGESFSKVLRREIKPKTHTPNGAEILRLALRPEGLLGMSEKELRTVERLREEMREDAAA